MSKVFRGLVIAGQLAAAFSALPGVSALAAQSTERDLPAKVTVDNTRDVPVVVYLDREPLDVRLGTVQPHSMGVLPLPRYLTEGETFRVFVHPEGGSDLASQDITLRRGEPLSVLVPTNEVGYLPPPPPEVIPDPGVGATTVTVQNGRTEPVVVFIERGEFDIRIGTAPPNRETTLAIPESLTSGHPDVEIFVHPERGADLNSTHFELTHGAHLLVKVPAPAR